MPKHRKGKGKASARPLAVPSMDNRPRYATPEVCHLPSPTPTPAKHKPSRSQGGTRVKASPQEIEELTERFEGGLEFRDESEEASSDGDSVVLRSGPWVGKGNPTGFLDSEDEEMFDQWEKEHREKSYAEMSREEWKKVAEFFLIHAPLLVGGMEDADGCGVSRRQIMISRLQNLQCGGTVFILFSSCCRIDYHTLDG